MNGNYQTINIWTMGESEKCKAEFEDEDEDEDENEGEDEDEDVPGHIVSLGVKS
jgi:hypothetical protein